MGRPALALAVSLAWAACASTTPRADRADRAARAGVVPRRCAWQLGIVRAGLGVSAGKPAAATVIELARLGDVYLEVKAQASAADAAACGREVEPLLRGLAIVWGREAHHHEHAPWAEQLLALHATLFPDAPDHGEVAFELGAVIAGLTTCGCDGRRDESARWRAAARAFAEARTSRAQVDVLWQGERAPLAEAAARAEAFAKANAERGAGATP